MESLPGTLFASVDCWQVTYSNLLGSARERWYSVALPKLLLLTVFAVSCYALGPQPGDVYREYYVAMGGGKDWRVTDPQPKHKNAWRQLPNSVLRVSIDDLKGARRAEVQIDRWGGHFGTTGKRIRFNGKPWVGLPELSTTPAGRDASCYMSQDNPIVEIPIGDLREGQNTLEGTSGDQWSTADKGCKGFGWGQWGWYGAVVRIYYDHEAPRAAGRIASPAAGSSFEDNPSIRFAAAKASEVDRVDVLAWFEGADENGDGVFRDWHHAYRYVDLAGHVGTAMSAPFTVRWDTSWVPDQEKRSIKLMARVRDRKGFWRVSPAVENLTLRRRGRSVKLYAPQGVPERFWVRAGQKKSSQVAIPEADLKRRPTDAALVLRTWNGFEENFRFNDAEQTIDGANHNFAITLRPVPVSALQPGVNTISFHSTTEHHGPEILWPGPALLVRYGAPAPAMKQAAAWLNPDYHGRIVLKVTAAARLSAQKPVEAEFDLKELGAIDAASLRTAECRDAQCAVLKDGALTAQLDRESETKGTLIFRLRESLAVGQGRYIHVYFRKQGTHGVSFTPPEVVTVEDNVDHAGQPSFRVNTDGASYVYHKEGAGFASIFDRDKNDWIGYAPGGRSAGEFRGIPNLGPYFHPGYSGEKGSRTTVVSRGPLRVRLRSETNNGKFAALWDFFPAHARMTLLQADQPYWFLYEGTPGGKLDVEHDYWTAADGKRRPVTENWNADFKGPEWIYFGDGRQERALFLFNHQDDEANDQFYQMEGNMTVFGFGRQHRCCGRYMTAAPARFTIGLLETGDFKVASPEIVSAAASPAVEVVKIERRLQ